MNSNSSRRSTPAPLCASFSTSGSLPSMSSPTSVPEAVRARSLSADTTSLCDSGDIAPNASRKVLRSWVSSFPSVPSRFNDEKKVDIGICSLLRASPIVPCAWEMAALAREGALLKICIVYPFNRLSTVESGGTCAAHGARHGHAGAGALVDGFAGATEKSLRYRECVLELLQQIGEHVMQQIQFAHGELHACHGFRDFHVGVLDADFQAAVDGGLAQIDAGRHASQVAGVHLLAGHIRRQAQALRNGVEHLACRARYLPGHLGNRLLQHFRHQLGDRLFQ